MGDAVFTTVEETALRLCHPIGRRFGARADRGAARAGDKEVEWKPIEQALLRVDDQPVKNWNVYEESKKGDPLVAGHGQPVPAD